MKKKNSNKKLHLSRETLRDLTSADTPKVPGAMSCGDGMSCQTNEGKSWCIDCNSQDCGT